MLLITSAVWMGAQQPLSLADADLRGATMFEQSGLTGMVLVFVRNQEVMMKGYGETFPAVVLSRIRTLWFDCAPYRKSLQVKY
jgi:hypothetical protein